MKTIQTAVLIFIALNCQAKTDYFQFNLEIISPGTIKSDHVNNCKPVCANQNNAGQGFVLGVTGDLDFSVFYIELVNSYGDKGAVKGFEPINVEYKTQFARAEAAIWVMEIYGYKHGNKDIVVRPPPWPKFEIGINPLFFWIDNFYINKNLLIFPGVEIEWWSIGFYREF